MTLAQKLYESAGEKWPGPWVPWERLPADAQEHYERLADVATAQLYGSDAAVSAARVDELLDVIARLVACRKDIEYSTREEQRAWRVARAVLVEAGR